MNYDPQQLAAILSDAANTLVVAGPGSGKSRVLVERVLGLIRSGSTGIVVVTFTNSAAGEVIQRLKDARRGSLEKENVLHVGTIHAFMLKQIIEHVDDILYPNQIAVVDSEQSRAVLDDAIKAQRYRGALRSVKESVARGPLHYFRNAPAADSDKLWSKEDQVAAEYYRRMREGGMIDYDSILELGLDVLKRNGCGCRHLLVDEWQDTGPMDWQIFQAIKAKTRFYVGDPSQAIFGFRHRQFKGASFAFDPSSWKTRVLELNHRSSAAVCEAASRLIAHNTNRTEKKCVSATGESGVVEFHTFATELSEINHVVEWLGSRKEQWNESAVLARTNWIAERFSRALRDAGVEVSSRLAPERPADWRETRDAIAFLANPDSDVLAYRVIERTRGSQAADTLQLEAAKLFTTINRLTLDIRRTVTSDTIVDRLRGLVLSEDSIRIIEQLLASNETITTARDVSLAIATEDTTERGPGVTVTTYHGAKGCEWDTVLLPAFSEGVIPHLKSNTEHELEEERRCAFVALTRARLNVYLSHAESRGVQWKGEAVKHEPSRFLREIGL